MNTSTSLTPMSQDDTLALAIEFCRINPVFFLKLWTALIVSGLCVTGLADVGGVYFALAQRYVDAFGHFAGNPVELLAISLITLCAYFSMGILYDRNYRWAAGGLYGVVLCLLALSLWQTESPRFEEIYAGSSVQTGNVLAAPSAAADTPAPAPFLFLAFCDLVFAFAFTLAGLLFIWFKQTTERAPRTVALLRHCPGGHRPAGDVGRRRRQPPAAPGSGRRPAERECLSTPGP